jgi:GR25 family glycosyltransferase involved in LPS biosynthesis
MYQDIATGTAESCLILEDDVVFAENFTEQFNKSLKNTPEDWDMICIGSGCNLRISSDRLIPGQIAYKKQHPASKCTDSYIITKKAAEKICKTIVPFNFPIDWELNYQLWHHNMNVYWWEPPVTKQGSQCGLYGSEIQ